MAGPDRRRRSRSGQIRDALVWGAILGGAAGAIARGTRSTDRRRPRRPHRRGALRARPRRHHRDAQPGRSPSRCGAHRRERALHGAVRLAAGARLGADATLLTAVVSGALLGLLGLRPRKLALGLVVGAGVGASLARSTTPSRRRWSRPRSPSRTASIAAAVYRKRPLVRDHGRGGPGRRAALRRALRGALAVRRRRLRRAARRGPRRHVPAQPARRRDPRLARQPARPDVRPGPRAPAHPRVLRAHQPLQALDRPRVAALDEAGLRGVQARRRRAARPGRDPLEHRGGAARDGEHDRHDRPRRRRGHRHPRLDPDVRGLGQADLRRHLHELPPRRPRLRQRRLPDPERELHRHAAAPQRGRRATSC